MLHDHGCRGARAGRAVARRGAAHICSHLAAALVF